MLISLMISTFSPPRVQFEYAYESGYAKVCSYRREGLSFDVQFGEGDLEKGVVIKNSANQDYVQTFNNYYGQDVIIGNLWKSVGGRFETRSSKDRICYLVIAFHKETPPHPASDWINSHMKFGPDRMSVTFVRMQGSFNYLALVHVKRCRRAYGENVCVDIP